jgi:CBS domain-containing protein
MASIDPAGFLRATPPFQALPPALFELAAQSLEVGCHPAGAVLVRRGGTPLEHLYVVRKGSVRIERGGQTLRLIEEGETFGYTSLLTGQATLDVFVEEDLLAYRIPGDVFTRLLSDARFAGHFAAGLADRLRTSLADAPVAAFQPDLGLDVRQLVRGPPLWVGPDATVGDAAKAMRAEGISSVLVATEPPSIVTDRDFRNRVLAEGLGADTPVVQAASSPLRTVPSGMPLSDVWAALLDAGVHHLPVEDAGRIVGVVTSNDLLRVSGQGPMAVLRRVERLTGRDTLGGYARTVAEMASALVAGGLEVRRIAGLVARLNDALVQRILRWAEDDLGPPPTPFAWVAFGSEGRMEQTLLTDQDNALVHLDVEGRAGTYWERLAERVVGDLVAAGFPPCAGGFMATRWNDTLPAWQARFARWIDAPDPQALLEAAILFDFRRVAGALDLAPLEALVANAPRKPVFLRFLARAALGFRPPAALLLRLRGESSMIDLKAQGIMPIVGLARCYGLESGARARGTLERLAAARSAGLMDPHLEATVGEAYRFLLALRLRLQLRQLQAGAPASNTIALSELTALDRTHLKDAFRGVRVLQDRAVRHYRLDFGP